MGSVGDLKMSERSSDEEFRRLLWFLLGGSRGGENRAKILIAIRSRPSNLNQLAKLIRVDYRSVQHHMNVLQKNNLVMSSGQRYGVIYSVHPWLAFHFQIFEQVCGQLGYVTLPQQHITIDTAEKLAPPKPQIGLVGDGLHL